MPYNAGGAYFKEFTVSSATGAAIDADALPTATASKNGTDDGAFSLTVANMDTGRYKVTGTVPIGYIPGDVFSVSLSATVGGIVAKAIIDTQTIEVSQTGDAYAEALLIKAKTDLLPTDPADQSLLIVATDAIATALTALSTVVTTTGASLTALERQAIADAILSRSLGTESYAADGAVPTLAEMQFMLLSALTQFGIVATSLTTRKLDGTTPAMVYTLDSATSPTSRVRAS